MSLEITAPTESARSTQQQEAASTRQYTFPRPHKRQQQEQQGLGLDLVFFDIGLKSVIAYWVNNFSLYISHLTNYVLLVKAYCQYTAKRNFESAASALACLLFGGSR